MAKPRSKTISAEIGASGTILLQGMLSNTDYNMDLTGDRAIDTYEEMRRSDGTVKSALLAVMLPILAAKWRVDPASNSPEDKKIAEDVWYKLTHMSRSFHDTLREALNYLTFGRYLFEIIWKLEDDGSIGIKKLAPRMPKTVRAWAMKDGGDGIQQLTQGGQLVDIPIEKLLIFVNDKEGDNWEGISILRAAYKHYHMKTTLEKIDVIAHERQGLGIPKAKVTANLSPEKKAELEDILSNMHANEAAYLIETMGVEISMLDMKGTATRDPHRSISYHKREILMSVLAAFLDLGSAGGSGSYSLGQTQSDFFLLSENKTAKDTAEVFNKYLIPRLVDLNYTVKDYPNLTCTTIGSADIEKITTGIQRMKQAGNWTPDIKVEKVLREQMNLPDVPEDAAYADPNQQAALDEQLKQQAQKPPTAKEQLQPDQQIKPKKMSRDDFLHEFTASMAKELREAANEFAR